jgi:Transglutaminase elicitor
MNKHLVKNAPLLSPTCLSKIAPALVVAAGCFAVATAQAAQVSSEWLQFQKDSKAYVLGHPMRRDSNGNQVPSIGDSVFSASEIRNRSFIEKKAEARRELRRNRAFGLFEEEADLQQKVAQFIDAKEFAAKGLQPIYRLEEIDAKGLLKGDLPEAPWSGSYWPIYQGSAAARYASKSFVELQPDWKAYYNFMRTANLESVLTKGSDLDMDSLSPAEKYDLLIGVPSAANKSSEGFLTPSLWAEGRRYFENYGKVETWMGICHGWAPAAFMVPRPAKAVVAQGIPERAQKIKFYPADTKGLVSLLWAKGDFQTHSVGGRCENKNPKVDPESGRLLEPECFDVNPALWHMTLVNQLGLAKRSFVIDAAYDYEVWNQPIKSYRYRYFNPQTGVVAFNAAAATIKKADYSKDKFAKFRSARAAAYVGVQMELTYVSENWNFQAETDDASTDVLRTVTYLYDLELDANGNLMGGEWYRNEHPDFEWMVLDGARAESSGDARVSREGWMPSSGQIPAFWRDIAIATARFNGEPLAAIIEPIVQESARR